MSFGFPLIGLILAILASIAGKREPAANKPRAILQDAIALLILLIASAFVLFKYAPESDRLWLGMGAILGIGAALLGSRAANGFAAAAGWGVAAAMVCQCVGIENRASVQIGLIVTAGIASALVGCPAAGLGAVAIASADRLGKLSGESDILPMAGSALGIVMLLCFVLTPYLKKTPWLKFGIAFILLAIGGYALGTFWLKDPIFGVIIALGAVCGFVVNFLMPEEGAGVAGSIGICAVIGISLATIAFALGRGTGMSLAFASAFALLAALGNMRAVLTLGPLLSLALFRDFRTSYPDLARAFDIGQHYAIVGLVIGMIVPLVFIDWNRTAKLGTLAAIALGLWSLILLGAAPLTIVFLGTYGAAGFIIGSGLSGIAEALRNGNSATSLSLGAGLAGAAMVSYGWLSASLNLARDQKVPILIWAGIGIALLTILIVLLSRDFSGKGAANESN